MEVLNHTRKDILKVIAKNSQSASSIAREVKLSLPYTLSQLAVLEAAGYLKKEKSTKKSYGKPRLMYSIKKPILELFVVTEQQGTSITFAGKNPEMDEYLQLIAALPASLTSVFSEYYWKHIEYHSRAIGYGVLSTSPSTVELLAITTHEHLERLRKKISHFEKGEEGKNRKVVCWVHTVEEIIEGTNKKDEYYLTIQKKITPLLDKENTFARIREGITNE